MATRTKTKPITDAEQSWPASKVEMRDVKSLLAYPRNARVHSSQQVDQIVASMQANGWTMPMLVDEQGVIIAGHGRLAAANKLGLDRVPVMVATGWTDEQKRGYRLADNQIPMNASWDLDMLKIELTDLKKMDYQLDLIGFADLQMAEFFAGLPGESNGGDGEHRGAVLELINITIADPKHKVEHGDRYTLGQHHLVCVSVVDGWPSWQPLLTPGALFCPYPGVFVPFSKKASTNKLVMVQPDTYVAGHILDRYAEVNGKKTVRKVAA